MLDDDGMTRIVQIGVPPAHSAGGLAPKAPRARVFWLQGVTLGWMLVEFGVAAYAAATAHSTVLLAFSSDSLVELMSAVVVLFQWIPGLAVSQRNAARAASVLLFVLAFVVVAAAVASLSLGLRPESSRAGIAISVAALLAMPVLALLKRMEARRSGNAALAADAAQSATCAYLALISLVGLGSNALFHLAWFDAVAALAAVPILLKEGRATWKGQTCNCC